MMNRKKQRMVAVIICILLIVSMLVGIVASVAMQSDANHRYTIVIIV